MALYNVDWIARCTFSYHVGRSHNITISVFFILTSLFGFGGAAVQLRHMWQFRNSVRRRLSANPKIIFWLAISDLIACVARMVLVIVSLAFDKPSEILYAICATFQAILLVGIVSSVIWTSIFAVDQCLQMCKINGPMMLYHILTWLPLFIYNIVGICINRKHKFESCNKPTGVWKTVSIVISTFPFFPFLLVNITLFFITYKKVKHLLRCTGIFSYDEREALKITRNKYGLYFAVLFFSWLPYVITQICFVTINERKRRGWFIASGYTAGIFIHLQGFFNYFVYRYSFKVEPNFQTSQPGLLRPPPNAGEIIQRMIYQEPLIPKENKIKATQNYNSIKKYCVSSKKTEMPPYQSRLLGECNCSCAND
ncbi:uncharacterized protein LOC124455483 [Xenia sp. Carnegie-2017]|uniref:uncharacterized protein LOC124455483 n=1 Tax=Xenia sp. Carnegie-2017 TaxID=2897299 RepID=UPI001F04569D|nr:uncharacterized protein LOC124455483 [Xenia sp. Carnegie-2017]XP_046862077.1 uncharacterized protein LOC124455483 [Xenia sp. Carnegie-2017]